MDTSWELPTTDPASDRAAARILAGQPFEPMVPIAGSQCQAARFADAGYALPVVADARIPDGTAILASFDTAAGLRSCTQRYLDELILRELRKPNPRAICIITGL